MDQDQQAIPIYDAIAQAVHKWDILGLTKFDDFACETVAWLLQHLPEAPDVHSVESLVLQACAEQQGASDCSPDQLLMITSLAHDLWSVWTDYRHRSEQPTFAQVRFKSRMRRFVLPQRSATDERTPITAEGLDQKLRIQYQAFHAQDR